MTERAEPPPATAPETLPPLIQGLLRPEAYPHPVQRIRLLQTHISWILLTGQTAYKIKKPVDFGFVNFTTLERRHHFCREEVRLNRRLSPALYQGVVAIHGTPEQPRLAPDPEPDTAPPANRAADGPAALDYAVRMLEFPQQALLPAALQRGEVNGKLIDALADRLARFHVDAAPASPRGPYGTPEAVLEPVLANLSSLARHGDPGLAPRLQRLGTWVAAQRQRLAGRFSERLDGGRVRECHGDLHLGNLLLGEQGIEVFDCLEFNPSLRWIDPISDLAFLAMDLQVQGESALAWRLLNRWLDQSGDYDGMELWAWYRSYRALVRAKVAALAGQTGEVERYVQVAEAIAVPSPRALVLCHGVSGSGKSTGSGRLLEALGAIRLRSDVERKRRFGLWGVSAAGTPVPAPVPTAELYAPAVSRELFEQVLPAQALGLLRAGFSVIVDATFLHRPHRQRMAAVARQAGVPLLILSFSAPLPVLEQRLRQRQATASDPSDADPEVLHHQWQQQDPLTPEEAARSLTIGPAIPESSELASVVRRRLDFPAEAPAPS